MKRIITWLFLYLPFCATAQQMDVYIINEKPVIDYAVKQGETTELLAAKYRIKTADILFVNSWAANTTPSEGQVIKLPIITLIKNRCDSECIKLFHKVQPKEGLFRISKNYGSFTVAELRKMNNLKSDNMSVGSRLLVGYLATDMQLEEAHKKEDAVLLQPKLAALKNDQAADNDTQEDSAPKRAAKVYLNETDTLDTEGHALTYAGNGFFEKDFKTSTTENPALAATFKTNLGWNDGKFYVLMNEIPHGTIVKLTNPESSRFIYARVLGELPDVKSNREVVLRVNNAGAVALGIAHSGSFEVTIAY